MKSSQKLSVYQDTMFNKTVEDATTHILEFKTYVVQTAAIMDELPSKFGPTLAYHMDKLKVSSSALADRSLINEDVIRRYRNNTTKGNPSIRTVIALCVGLQLPPPLCFDLTRKAKYDFSNGDPEDIAFQTIICSMTRNSIYECNELLISLGLKPLSKIT